MSEIERKEMLEQIAENLPKEELLYDLADFFKIFGDSSRIRILSFLREEKLCVSEISFLTQLSPSAVSHQLRILRQARLFAIRKLARKCFIVLMIPILKKS